MGLDVWFEKRTNIQQFRKINFLVKFFEEYGLDTDSQEPLEISKEMIKDLIDRCLKVINNPKEAEKLLPTCEGFFFGSVEYDNSYYSDVFKVLTFCTNKLLPMLTRLDNNESLYFNIWY